MVVADEYDRVVVQSSGALLVGRAQGYWRDGLRGHGVTPHQSHTNAASMRAADGSGARSTHSFGACGALPAVTPYRQQGVAPPPSHTIPRPPGASATDLANVCPLT